MDGIVRAILDRGSGKGSDVVPGERSEFHSLSIDGIVQIIDEHGSRKVRDSLGERRKLDLISIDTDRVDGEIN